VPREPPNMRGSEVLIKFNEEPPRRHYRRGTTSSSLAKAAA
jgi:hypothetical protein